MLNYFTSCLYSFVYEPVYGFFWETLREIKVKGVYSLGASPKVALLVLYRFSRSATRSSTGIATIDLGVVGRIFTIRHICNFIVGTVV